MADNETSTVLLGELDSLTKDPKATDDYSARAVEVIEEAAKLAKTGRIQDAIDALLAVEKKARQAADGPSVSKIACQVIRLCRDADDWAGVNDHLVLLSKKRSQLKRVLIDLVQLCMTWIEECPTKEVRLSLIETLSTVTAGKIFVEVERARVVRILARIKETEGNIEEAATLLQEVQVETFGAMDRREKAEYILEQMRIVLAKDDFVRCQIISRKINTKLLEAEDFQDIKLKYYEYMVRYYLHEKDYLEVAKAHAAAFHTPSVLENRSSWQPLLEGYILYLLISSFCNEQLDLLNRIQSQEKKKLEQIPIFSRMVKEFLTWELIPWPLVYEKDINGHEVFSSKPHEGGPERWQLFRTRVLQHNVKTLAEYYSRIRLDRMSNLLDITRAEVESQISSLVTSGFLVALMDRPAGLVSFGGRKDVVDNLNDWSHDVAKVLDLLEESSHLIEKEKMVHAAQAKKAHALRKPQPAAQEVAS